MAFTVTRYNSPQALEDAIGGTVTVAKSEDALAAALDAAISLYNVVNSGNFYTVIDRPTTPPYEVLGHGAMYTVLIETL
jgi:hypothetical protein